MEPVDAFVNTVLLPHELDDVEYVNAGVGGEVTLLMVSVCVDVAVHPLDDVTVSVMVFTPVVTNVKEGFAAVELPSPLKFHE
jgi:hypothetical protein